MSHLEPLVPRIRGNSLLLQSYYYLVALSFIYLLFIFAFYLFDNWSLALRSVRPRPVKSRMGSAAAYSHL
jgi:hypothetical protein